MVVSRSRTIASGYRGSSLCGAELEKVKGLPYFGVTSDSKLSFETNLREVVSKAARSLGIVC